MTDNNYSIAIEKLNECWKVAAHGTLAIPHPAGIDFVDTGNSTPAEFIQFLRDEYDYRHETLNKWFEGLDPEEVALA